MFASVQATIQKIRFKCIFCLQWLWYNNI